MDLMDPMDGMGVGARGLQSGRPRLRLRLRRGYRGRQARQARACVLPGKGGAAGSADPH
jgi:hypothetical protein